MLLGGGAGGKFPTCNRPIKTQLVRNSNFRRAGASRLLAAAQSRMENGRQEEREEGGWREVPALLKAETVQAAVRNHLESKGLGARQLEPKQRLRRPRMAGKKVEGTVYASWPVNNVSLLPFIFLSLFQPPLPPQVWVSDERVCFGVALEAPQPKQLLEPLDGRGIGVWLPRVFAECVRVLRENVGVAGIFRKSGSLTRQRVLRVSLKYGVVVEPLYNGDLLNDTLLMSQRCSLFDIVRGQGVFSSHRLRVL